MNKPKQVGTDIIGYDKDERVVPVYEVRAGSTVEKTARELGLRCLARREEGHVVAIIKDSGLTFRCIEGVK